MTIAERPIRATVEEGWFRLVSYVLKTLGLFYFIQDFC